jgi:TolB-like protein
VAWVIAQAMDLAADNFDAPDWVMKITLSVLIAGLPIAMILSWAFELTPEGVMKSEEVPAAKSITPKTGRKLNHLTTVALILALAFIAWDKLGPGGSPAATTVTEKSVAVLPFADLSELQDQEWFADGLTEEILNALARLPELKVTARTSSFEFKNTNIDIGEIAGRLGVAHVVEGSVRRIGNNLRVTAQLIRAEDGFHLWSDTYDRNTEDLFEVQNDVAEKVAATLNVILDDDKRDRMFAIGTRNVEAYELYLQGKDLFEKAHLRDYEDPVTLADGNALVARALELDPEFAQAAILHSDRYAHFLIEGYSMIIGDADDLDVAGAYDQLQHDYEIAMANARDEASRAIVEINHEFFSSRWHRIPTLMKRIVEHVGSDVATIESGIWLDEIVLLTGEYDFGQRLFENRVLADPLSQSAWLDTINIRLNRRDIDGASDQVEKVRAILGASIRLQETEIVIALLRGDTKVAAARIEDAGDLSGDFLYMRPLLAAVQGDYETAARLAGELEAASEWPNYNLISVYHVMNDKARMRSLVQRIDQHLVGPAILAIQIASNGGSMWFDIEDAPNLKQRFAEAGIDPARFKK